MDKWSFFFEEFELQNYCKTNCWFQFLTNSFASKAFSSWSGNMKSLQLHVLLQWINKTTSNLFIVIIHVIAVISCCQISLKKLLIQMNLLGIETSDLFCSTSVIRIPQKKASLVHPASQEKNWLAQSQNPLAPGYRTLLCLHTAQLPWVSLKAGTWLLPSVYSKHGTCPQAPTKSQ